MNTHCMTHRKMTTRVCLAALLMLLPLAALGEDQRALAQSLQPGDTSRVSGATLDNASAQNNSRNDISPDDNSPDDNSPEAVLRTFGLIQKRSRWLTAAEARLHADLGDLRRLERQYRQATAALARDMQQATQLRARVEKARDEVDRFNELLDGGTLTGDRYNAVVDEVNRRADFINLHVALIASPLGAAIEPTVTSQARQVIELYGQISALVARSNQTLDGLGDQYAKLSANPAVRDTLAKLGGGAELGPTGDYASERRRLARLADSLWTGVLPLAIVDNQPLLPVVVGERQYGIFALSREQGFSLISSKLAKAVGAEVDTTVKPSRLRAFGADDYQLYPAIVAQVRLGQYTAHNVTFMVLPPEAEEVTSVLDLGLLDGLEVQLDLPALTARVRELSAGETAGNKASGGTKNP